MPVRPVPLIVIDLGAVELLVSSIDDDLVL